MNTTHAEILSLSDTELAAAYDAAYIEYVASGDALQAKIDCTISALNDIGIVMGVNTTRVDGSARGTMREVLIRACVVSYGNKQFKVLKALADALEKAIYAFDDASILWGWVGGDPDLDYVFAFKG